MASITLLYKLHLAFLISNNVSAMPMCDNGGDLQNYSEQLPIFNILPRKHNYNKSTVIV